jgi:hypothetical protein
MGVDLIIVQFSRSSAKWKEKQGKKKQNNDGKCTFDSIEIDHLQWSISERGESEWVHQFYIYVAQE